jgi:hypothetical protein
MRTVVGSTRQIRRSLTSPEGIHLLSRPASSILFPTNPVPSISPETTATTTTTSGGKKRFIIPGLRWWIIALLFGAAVRNNVDRQTLSALAPTIQKDPDMDDRDHANVSETRSRKSFQPSVSSFVVRTMTLKPS